MLKVPVLTYHSTNVMGNEYHNNDHIALSEDLVTIHEQGKRVISLTQLIQWHWGQLKDSDVTDSVVITFDDGSWFDYYDLKHPSLGLQPSFYNILQQHQKLTGHEIHASSFVIVSPDARKELDQTCLIGKGWWTDQWWNTAQDSGLISIENHSWDHNHFTLSTTIEKDESFKSIDDFNACEKQVRQAQDYLFSQLKNHSASFFAYPYGDFSEYLASQYLPENAARLGLKAAFTTEANYVTKNSNIWQMPRFVCGPDWNNKKGLIQLLSK